MAGQVQKVGLEKHPKEDKKFIQYGTAGFRTKAILLDHIMYRMGVLATLRSKAKKGSVIGVMITASHNPAPDNGVKLVDPAGEMLEQAWEAIATEVANADDEKLGEVIEQLVEKEKIDLSVEANVYIGKDTRPSSDPLSRAVLDGIEAAGGKPKDYGVVTTPQLHYFVVCQNTKGTKEEYGEASKDGYFKKLAQAFVDFKEMAETKGNYKNELDLDCANGVGAIAAKDFMEVIQVISPQTLKINIYSDNIENDQLLNLNCGADFVKVQQKSPESLPGTKLRRCVSFDGDADRVVYYYTEKGTDDKGIFHLLDGDRIATLIASYLKELLADSGIVLEKKCAIVQTAYANGSSTEYITNTLDVPVACVPTGVKHLHHKALDFDIGVYFEANGHGTVLYSPVAQDSIKNAASEAKNESAKKLKLFMDMTNQCVGDALSDMLLVESVLCAKGWDVQDWFESYQDLPNRQMKVRVADRTVIETTDAERKCVQPQGLQSAIDKLVKNFPKGRSFVRPSGTEDVVRVYSESDTQDNADQLGYEVGLAVHKLAGGVGEPTPKP